MMTHDEMIAVIQHNKDGGAIEVYGGSFWTKMAGTPSWDFKTYTYRPHVKPKQKQVVVIEKWLCKNEDSYLIIEADSSFQQSHDYVKIKLLDTYEVEI